MSEEPNLPITAPFEAHPERYDRWFDRHHAVSCSERPALGRFVDGTGLGLDIGVGTERFAGPLGIELGVDPSPAMLERPRNRGIEVICGVGEARPIRQNSLDTVFLVTTVCFLDDPVATFAEARRVLSAGGQLVIGYVDRESPLGQQYERSKADNPFYQPATFLTAAEVRTALETAGFESFEFAQTLFSDLDDMNQPAKVKSGVGDGSFVSLRATR